jgi:hypothetical protein
LLAISTPHLIDEICPAKHSKENDTPTQCPLTHANTFAVLAMGSKAHFGVKLGVTGIHGIGLIELGCPTEVLLLPGHTVLFTHSMLVVGKALALLPILLT